MNQSERVPAIIVGQTITALGTLRSLARVGINAFTVAALGDIVRRSRWYKPIPGRENLRPDELANWLPELDIERAVLFPCSDHAVWQASQLVNITKDRISMSIASTDTLESLVDKGRFASVLDQIDIPRPRTWMLEDGRIPVPIPEYIPGATDRHFFIDGFIDRHYEVRALFARQRLRMHPADFGNSSCMVSIPLDEVQGAVDSLRRLLHEINFNGIFSAEFKFDERDRDFKIIEVNARPWWYIEFASRCGVNVCEMAYADALGEDVVTNRKYRTGASMVYAWHDFFACRDSVNRGDVSIFTCAVQWIRSWRPIFAWDDPWPGVIKSSKFLLRQLGRPKRWLGGKR